MYWGVHEPRKGYLCFEGNLDLSYFCQLVAKAGMNLIVRLGPFVGVQANFGGLPGGPVGGASEPLSLSLFPSSLPYKASPDGSVKRPRASASARPARPS